MIAIALEIETAGLTDGADDALRRMDLLHTEVDRQARGAHRAEWILARAYLWLARANVLQASGRTDEAEQALSEASVDFATVHFPGGVAAVSYARANMATQNSAPPDECKRLLLDAEEQFELLSDQLGIAHCAHSLGQLAITCGRYDEADQHFVRARAGYQHEDHSLDVANCDLGLAEIARDRGEAGKALLLLSSAQQVYEAAGNEQGLGECMRLEATIELQVGRFAAADSLYRAAEGHFTAAGDVQAVANCVRGRGELARISGRMREAVDLLNSAKGRYEQLKDVQGVGNCLLALSRVARAGGEKELARSLLNGALAQFRGRHPRGVALCLRDLGELASEDGATDAAADLLNLAQQESEALGDPLATANALFLRAELAARTDQREASSLFRAAQQRYVEVSSPWSAVCLWRRAALLTHSDSGSRKERLDMIKRAVAQLELLHRDLGVTSDQLDFEERAEEMFRDGIGWAVEAGDNELAVELIAQQRGRLLYEERAISRSTLREVLSSSERAELDRSVNEADRAEEALAQLERRLGDSATRSREITVIERTRVENETAEQTRAAHGAKAHRDALLREAEYRAARRAPAPARPRFTALQRAVDQQCLAVACFVWRPDLHCALVLRPWAPVAIVQFADGSSIVHDVTQSRDEVIATVDALVDRLTERPTFTEQEWSAHLGWTRQALWAPIRELLGDLQVAVVPDYPLASIPFRLLHRGPGTLRVLPSLALLLAARADDDSPRARLFALGGDPGIDDEQPLAGIRFDLDLAQTVSNARVVKETEDPVIALLDERGDYELILISSHMEGGLDWNSSGIVLRQPNGSGDFVRRTVSVRELLHMPKRAGIVVLSGCMSAAPRAASDMLSIASAVLTATRAEAVVATLWPVEDMAATLVWAELLSRLAAAVPVDQSLAEALSVLADLQKQPDVDRHLSALSRRYPHCEAFISAASAWFEKRIARSHGGPLVEAADRHAWTILSRSPARL